MLDVGEDFDSRLLPLANPMLPFDTLSITVLRSPQPDIRKGCCDFAWRSVIVGIMDAKANMVFVQQLVHTVNEPRFVTKFKSRGYTARQSCEKHLQSGNITFKERRQLIQDQPQPTAEARHHINEIIQGIGWN